MCKPEASVDPDAVSVLSQYAGVAGKDGRPVVLGQGTFGTVYKAVRKDDPGGRAYAVKVMTKEWAGLGDLEKRLIKSEINTLLKCQHQHIIGERLLFAGLQSPCMQT